MWGKIIKIVRKTVLYSTTAKRMLKWICRELLEAVAEIIPER